MSHGSVSGKMSYILTVVIQGPVRRYLLHKIILMPQDPIGGIQNLEDPFLI